jgi:hypothetical protein
MASCLLYASAALRAGQRRCRGPTRASTSSSCPCTSPRSSCATNWATRSATAAASSSRSSDFLISTKLAAGSSYQCRRGGQRDNSLIVPIIFMFLSDSPAPPGSIHRTDWSPTRVLESLASYHVKSERKRTRVPLVRTRGLYVPTMVHVDLLDRVSISGPLAYETSALPLRHRASLCFRLSEAAASRLCPYFLRSLL